MNVLTGRLQDLDFVWRPLETSFNLDHMEREMAHFQMLGHQLKRSSAFVKYVTRSLAQKLITEPGDELYCYTMMYNCISNQQYSSSARDNNPAATSITNNNSNEDENDDFYGDDSDDEFDNDDEDDDNDDDDESDNQAASKQWTAVIAVVLDQDGQTKRNVMVLKCPDNSAQMSRSLVINMLDIAEMLGCDHVYVAVNRMLSPALERVQITSAFLNVGFQMQHPRVLSVEGHVLLGYEF